MTAYSFQQLIDFTRTSAGTFVGSNGLIQNSPQSRNLLLWTQEFDNAAWTKNAATVTANSTAAPDGTPTADTLLATAGTGVIPRVADTSVNTINGLAHTASIYVKAGTYTFFQIYLNSQASEWANFTLTGAGTATANGASTAAITALSNGWYRCSITYTAGGTDRRPFFMLAASGTATRAQAWNPAGTETVFLWGAQLEQAATASDYTRNVGGLFPPRFDYDPVTLAPRGILIEEQRTNLLTYSERFDNAAWTKVNATITANATVAPDGTSTADTLVEDATNNFHNIVQTAGTVGVVETFSAYVKPAGRSWIAFQCGSSVAYFNVSTGVVGNLSSATASIQNAGNGWYRCSMTMTRAGGTGTGVLLASANGTASYTGDGTSGVFLWGAQLEAGAFATSYIPTVASQVTRTADQASIVAPMFAPWYNQTAGTFVFEGTALAASGFTWHVLASNATTANMFGSYRSSGSISGFIANAGATQMEIGSGPAVANVPYKLAIAAQENSGNFSFNGNIGTNDTTLTMPAVTRLSLGTNAAGGGEFLNGHIRRVTFYPVRLSNTQLQALTA